MTTSVRADERDGDSDADNGNGRGKGRSKDECKDGCENDDENNGVTKAVWELMRGYMRAHPGLATLGFLSTLVTPVQDILLPHLTGRVVSVIRTGGSGTKVATAFLAIGVAVLLIQVAQVGADLTDARIWPTMQTHVRRHMLRCVLDLHDTSQVGDLETGDLIAKFIKVPWTISNWFETIKSIMPNILVYVAATAYFWWVDWVLGVGMLVAMVVTGVALVYNISACGGVSKARDESMNALQENIDEVLRNLPAIYAGNQKQHELDGVVPMERNFERLYYRTITCATFVKVWMVPMAVGTLSVVLWRCHTLLRRPRSTFDVGQFVSVFIVVLYIMMSMMRLVQHSRNAVYYWGVVQAAADTLVKCGPPPPPPSGDAAGGHHPPHQTRMQSVPVRASGGAVVTMRGVWFRHTPPGRDLIAAAVRNVDLSVRLGDRLALIGPMGSGKTTLMRLMMRLIEPSAGSVELHGVPYGRLSVDAVRNAFGYIPQNAPLFDKTVLENVTYGLPEDVAAAVTPDDAWAAVRSLGLGQVLGSLPDGMMTRVGKAGSRVSGGQRQAVWLIRMKLRAERLPQAPADGIVLLLDEPTSAMDPDSRKAVANAIRTFRTAVFISHDMQFVRDVATRVVQMRGGRIDGDSDSDSDERYFIT